MATKVAVEGRGLTNYYKTKIEDLEVVINAKTQDLRRLEAQRNMLNSRGRIRGFFFGFHGLMLFHSSHVEGRIDFVARTGVVCGRSGQSDEQAESAG